MHRFGLLLIIFSYWHRSTLGYLFFALCSDTIIVERVNLPDFLMPLKVYSVEGVIKDLWYDTLILNANLL